MAAFGFLAFPNKPREAIREGGHCIIGAVPDMLGAMPLLLFLALVLYAPPALAQQAGLATSLALHAPGAVPHAAFAYLRDVSGAAAWGLASGAADADAARAAALADCAEDALAKGVAGECRLGPAPPPARAGRLGPFGEAPFLRRWGPARARGVVVWGHGSSGPRGPDLRATATPGVVTLLNQAGWDVLRYDRHPAEDRDPAALERLLAGVEALRGSGYRRVVLGGVSRGGWRAMQVAAERPDAVYAVVALAPAAWGQVATNGRGEVALASFRAVVARLGASGVRLAVAVYDADPYDPSPAERAAAVAALPGALALWPEGYGGHGGGEDWRFTHGMGGHLRGWLHDEAPSGLHRGGASRANPR
jgi:hypothetical protein